MKHKIFGTVAATVACMGMVLPPTALAAAPAVNHGTDVALRDGGVLVGQVVDQQGVAKANAPVSIVFANHEVVRTTTDNNGVFAAKGLRGGQYQLVTDDGASVCRLWAADTAPPSARPAALVVTGNGVVRGQGPVHNWVSWMKAHPYITAGTVAGLVAIPIIVASNEDDDSGS
jgi:Carboxypeptidase regulatory-like domain